MLHIILQNYYTILGNLERRVIIDNIRKESNFIYNTSSLYNTGNLIVSRRPSKANKSVSNFTCCSKCKGFYTKNNVRHHFKECNQTHIGRKVLTRGRKVQTRIYSKASDTIRKIIFPFLKHDDICTEIRYDELVILRANKLCKKFRNQRHHDMVKSVEYIKRDNNESLKNVENFLKLLEEDYGTTINKVAEETVT